MMKITFITLAFLLGSSAFAQDTHSAPNEKSLLEQQQEYYKRDQASCDASEKKYKKDLKDKNIGPVVVAIEGAMIASCRQTVAYDKIAVEQAQKAITVIKQQIAQGTQNRKDDEASNEQIQDDTNQIQGPNMFDRFMGSRKKMDPTTLPGAASGDQPAPTNGRIANAAVELDTN
jgi:hypothetical protein